MSRKDRSGRADLDDADVDTAFRKMSCEAVPQPPCGRPGARRGPRLHRSSARTGFADGFYDIANDGGWVSVGIDHDTFAFAVNAIWS
jgi:hypothetical protein